MMLPVRFFLLLVPTEQSFYDDREKHNDSNHLTESPFTVRVLRAECASNVCLEALQPEVGPDQTDGKEWYADDQDLFDNAKTLLQFINELMMLP